MQREQQDVERRDSDAIFTGEQVEAAVDQAIRQVLDSCMEEYDMRIQRNDAKWQAAHSQMEAKFTERVEELERALAAQKASKILPGTRVRIRGLNRRSVLNGEGAKVLTFDDASGRYKCELLGNTSTENIIGCKVENLEILE